jgi:hypothetical protein
MPLADRRDGVDLGGETGRVSRVVTAARRQQERGELMAIVVYSSTQQSLTLLLFDLLQGLGRVCMCGIYRGRADRWSTLRIAIGNSECHVRGVWVTALASNDP